MIAGEYSTKIGEKKRVAIPKKFRDELGTDLIITRGYEQSLVLVNKAMWNKIAGTVLDGSFINRNIRETTRFLVGSATEINPDSQGRVVIPTGLFEYAKLSEEIVFVGLINWIEVWDKKIWDAKVNFLAENGYEIAAELNKLADNSGSNKQITNNPITQ
jgi:MraZ protein